MGERVEVIAEKKYKIVDNNGDVVMETDPNTSEREWKIVTQSDLGRLDLLDFRLVELTPIEEALLKAKKSRKKAFGDAEPWYSKD